MIMNLPDLRPQLAQAQDWLASLIDQIDPAQLNAPTPCDDWDVRDLVAHVYMGAGRVEAMGKGRPAESVQSAVDDLPADLGAGYREAIRAAQAAWADDAQLGREVHAPWGVVPGGAAIGGYLNEALTHGWDLATALGLPSTVDPELAELALRFAYRAIPAEGRDQMPFGEVVPSAPDAGPSERFINWMGRTERQPAELR
jgi:uncharacterized protein (TIGR03086 family)